LNNLIFKIIINMTVVFVLFGSDIRFLTPHATDKIFDAFFIFSIFLFIMEIQFSIVMDRLYLFRFFFWLDIISTISLIFEISFVYESLYLDKYQKLFYIILIFFYFFFKKFVIENFIYKKFLWKFNFIFQF